MKINDISFVKIKRNKIGAIAKKFLKKANCVAGYKFPNDLTITPKKSTKTIPNNMASIAKKTLLYCSIKIRMPSSKTKLKIIEY